MCVCVCKGAVPLPPFVWLWPWPPARNSHSLITEICVPAKGIVGVRIVWGPTRAVAIHPRVPSIYWGGTAFTTNLFLRESMSEWAVWEWPANWYCVTVFNTVGTESGNQPKWDWLWLHIVIVRHNVAMDTYLSNLQNSLALMLSYWVVATRFHVDLSLHWNIFHLFKCCLMNWDPFDHQHHLLCTAEVHFCKCVNTFLFVSQIFHTLFQNRSYTPHRKTPDSLVELC